MSQSTDKSYVFNSRFDEHSAIFYVLDHSIESFNRIIQ